MNPNWSLQTNFDDYEATAIELNKISQMLAEGKAVPGLEGILSRVWGSVFNLFRGFSNWLTNFFMHVNSIFNQNWIKYTQGYMDRLNANGVTDEQFSGSICPRGEKMQMEKVQACLMTVMALYRNMEKNLLNPVKTDLTPEMYNCIKQLEMNHCKVDLKRPSNSHAATRVTYGSLGRMGTAGFGTSFNVWFANIRKGFNVWCDVFYMFTDPNAIPKAVDSAERQLQAIYTRLEQSPDRERFDMTERINNIKARLKAYKAIHKAAWDLWYTTLKVFYIKPVNYLAINSGKMDSLTSWILTPKER